MDLVRHHRLVALRFELERLTTREPRDDQHQHRSTWCVAWAGLGWSQLGPVEASSTQVKAANASACEGRRRKFGAEQIV